MCFHNLEELEIFKGDISTLPEEVVGTLILDRSLDSLVIEATKIDSKSFKSLMNVLKQPSCSLRKLHLDVKEIKPAESISEIIDMLSNNQSLKYLRLNNVTLSKTNIAALFKAIQAQGKILHFETANMQHDFTSEKDY